MTSKCEQLSSKRRILFVNDEMEMGGVARVLNTLMKALLDDPNSHYEIDLLVLHKTGDLLKDIPSSIRILEGTPFFKTVDASLKQLIKSKKWDLVLHKIRLLLYMKTGWIKKKIEKERKKMLPQEAYDVELAAKEGFCTIFTAFGNSKRKVNWVLTDYSVCNYSKNHMELVKEALRRIDLNIADSVQAQEAYKKVFEIDHVITLHNLMDDQKVLHGVQSQQDELPLDETKLNVITVARLHPQKSIDRLLRASKAALLAGKPHQLYLVGSGLQEEELKILADQLELTNVTFCGSQMNPYRNIHKCDLFVLSSLYEGFATVINESLIAGTPVLSTEVAGVHEQIIKEDYGWVVANCQEALNQGFIQALDKTKLQEMKNKLQDYRYPNAEILTKFKEVL